MKNSSGLFTYLQATQLLQIDIQPFEIVDSIAQQVVFGLSCGKLALARYDAHFFDIGRPWSRIFLQSHSDVLARGARVLVFDDDLHGFVLVVADRDLISEGLLYISANVFFAEQSSTFSRLTVTRLSVPSVSDNLSRVDEASRQVAPK